MNAEEMIAQARQAQIEKYLAALERLSQEHGFRLKPGFVPVEGSEFIRPILTVEDMPGWEGPPTPREDKREAITSESPD